MSTFSNNSNIAASSLIWAVDAIPTSSSWISHPSTSGSTYEYLGSIELILAAVTSEENLDQSDSISSSHVTDPPWSSGIISGVYACGQCSTSEVIVVTVRFEWISGWPGF